MIPYKAPVNIWTRAVAKITMKTLVLLSLFLASCQAHFAEVYEKLRDCLGSKNAVVCLKEEALNAVNETVHSDQPITIYDTVDVVRDPNYKINDTGEALPEDAALRSRRLTELLYEKMEEFLSSRTLQLRLNSVIEGRKKKGKTGLMIMIGGMAMAGMMAKMMMSKVAFLAGAAFIIAKIALLLSAIMIAKKMGGGGGGGGGETQHVVYTTSQSDYGHGGGGGGGGGGYGYARSWHVDKDAQKMAYSAHVPEDRDYFF